MITDIEKQKLELSLKIDELIKELKNKFLTSAAPVASSPDGKMGVWDHVKNWWNKFRYGKFGNLAQVEKDPEAKTDAAKVADEPKSECYQFSFQEYRAIKDSCDILETIIEKNQDNLNEEESENLKNLRLFRIIDDWGKKFKQVILDLVYPDKPVNPTVAPAPAGGEGVRKSKPTVGISDPEEKEKAATATTPGNPKKPKVKRSRAVEKSQTKANTDSNTEKESTPVGSTEEEKVDSPEAVRKAVDKIKSENPEIDFNFDF